MKYNPHEYQKYCTDYIIDHPYCGIFLDCGVGKRVIGLTGTPAPNSLLDL